MGQTLVVPDPLADLARLEGVPSAVASTRAAINVLLRDRGMRPVPPETSAAALLAAARASARLSEDPGRWLPGSVRLATDLLGLSGLLRVAPAQAVARAHTLLAHGCVPQERLGRLRDDPAVAERMSGVSRLLTTRTEAPAPVLAAVVHGEVASVRPFGAGDDVLARALEQMVLVSAGVDPSGVVVTPAGHLRRSDAYGPALAGYADGGLNGVRGWLLHCLAAMADGAEESTAGRT